MVVMVWLPSGGLFCGRLAGVMFCAFLGVLEVPVLAGLMLLSQDLLNIRFFVRTIKDWNDLPPDILGIDDYEAFKTSLIVHRSQ
jgi:hypothetical protein